MAPTLCVLDTWGYKPILTIYNTCSFSTATMVGRAPLNVTFYVHCLSCYGMHFNIILVSLQEFNEFGRQKVVLNFWRWKYFFFNFSTPVYKMWIIQEPNTLELWSKLHFEEGEKTENIYHV